MKKKLAHVLTIISEFILYGAFAGVAHSQVMPTQVPYAELADHPHRFNGLIKSRHGDVPGILFEDSGSGAVALHPKLIFTCAHVLVDERRAYSSGIIEYGFNKHAEYPVAKDIRWYANYNDDTPPALVLMKGAGDSGFIPNLVPGGTLIRQYLIGESYADLAFAAWDPVTKKWRSGKPFELAEGRDFAIFWGYETMTGDFAPISAKPSELLRSPLAHKLVTGYPAHDHQDSSSDYIIHGRLYQTNVGTLVYQEDQVDGFKSEILYPRPKGAIKTIGGNSGGPVWARYPGERYELTGITLANSGGMIPLDATYAKKVIETAKKLVRYSKYPQPGEYPTTPETKSGYNITPGWSAIYTLGELVADEDIFELTIATDGSYQIETTAAPPSADLDTVGMLSGSGFKGTKVDDDSGDGKNFRFSVYLTKGKYKLVVRGAYPTLRGQYRLGVSALPGNGTQQIEVVGAGKTTPIKNYSSVSQASAALGTHFGSITGAVPTVPSKTLTFNIRNTGGGVLALTGTPKVAISGLHASQFQVVSQPAEDVIPARVGTTIRNTTFSIRYLPTIVGNHIAKVAIQSDSIDDTLFQFAIRGSAPNLPGRPIGDISHLVSASLDVTGWESSQSQSSSALDYGGDIDMFRFVLTERKLCTFWTTGDADTFGTLYQLASKQTKLLSADAGGDNRNFSLTRVLDPGTYIVEVKGANADVAGDYTLHATQTAVSGYAVVTNAKGIPIADGTVLADKTLGTDFGSVDYRKGTVEQTFTLTNNGFAEITLTGSPKIAINEEGSNVFSIKAQPSASVLKPGAKVSFVLRYAPFDTRVSKGILRISLSGAGLNDSIYDFGIYGDSAGAVSPLAISKRLAANAYGSFFFEATGRWKGWGTQAMGDEFDGSYFDALTEPTLSVASLRSPPMAVAGGGYQIHAARQDGALFSWGNPDLAGFGDGKSPYDGPVHQPVPAKRGWGSAQVIQISGGAHHTLLLTNAGGVWAWGDQTQGQLGNGVVKSPASNMSHILTTPVEITKSFAGSRIIRVAAGSQHNLALDSEGQIWAWGSNAHGQLGLGHIIRQAKPVKIAASLFGGSRIVGIACSSFSSFAVSESGVAWAWGNNERGVLGDGTFISRSSPVTVLDATTGSPHAFKGEKIIQLTAGSDQAFILTAEGNVWTWGERVITREDMSNLMGMDAPALLRLTEKLTAPMLLLDAVAEGGSKIIEMAAGGERLMLDAPLPQPSLTHGLYLRADGSVWASGSNERGQVGTYYNNGQPDLAEVIQAPISGAGYTDPSFVLKVQTLDSDGNASAGWVGELVEQPDGKIVISGLFDDVNGVRRNGLARIFPDGSVDPSFSAQKIANLNGLCVMNDGKFLISSGGGDAFSFEEDQPPYLRKLLPNGSPDSSFSFQLPVLGAGREVYAIHECKIQRDGKVLIVGSYKQPSDEFYGDFIARVNANGSRDTSFPPRVYDGVDSIQLQADEKIMLNGWQLSDQGQRAFLSRLTSSGVTDPSFSFFAAESEYIFDFAILPGGKVMVGGDASNTWSGLARLGVTGQIESILNPGPGLSAHQIRLQADQTLRVFDYNVNYVYWLFPDESIDHNSLPGQDWLLTNGSRLRNDDSSYDGTVIRTFAEPVSERLSVTGKSRIEWLRGGAALEVTGAIFELSTNQGSSWTALGSASRISGGWELSGITLPSAGRIRARARVYQGASSSVTESVVDFY